MEIGIVPNPRQWEHWEQAATWLEPARATGDFDTLLEPHELLWAVMDEGECIAAATTWLGEGFAEVKLVGGRDHARWITELDRMIGAAAHEAGAKWLQAMGRRGWTKVLRAQGWEVMIEDKETAVYRRMLEG